MMNRIALESFASGRRASVGSHLRCSGGKINSGDADDGLDLFSRTRRSDVDQIRLEKLAVGAARIKGMEDLLDSEIGKHDYDWLLTPPETPLYPSAVARESPLSLTAPPAREGPLSSTATPGREGSLSSTAPRGRTTIRSVSNTRPSRLSASQTENGHSTGPVRSSSVTRPSVSNTYSNSSFSNNNRTSVLNTSTASVTSSRPSTPGNRSTTVRSSVTSTTARASVTSKTTRPSVASTATRPSSASMSTRPSSASTSIRPSSASMSTRPSASTTARPSSTLVASRTSSTSSGARSSSTSRPATSRLPTPTRTQPISSTSTNRRNNSRPSTPTSSRPQTPSNPNPNLNSRASSRPATPTRRPTSSSGSLFPSTTTRISSTNARNPTAPSSRPSSPGPRARAPVRPIDLPDFPADAPPNLRTKLPERPASAGRTRPGMALTVSRANSNSDAAVPAVTAATASSNRRNHAPPVMSRGRFPENPPKAATKLHGNNGHVVAITAENGLRRPTKSASTTESTGFGRNISKKSLDMALRHMDIRQGMGGIRASSLFPQSIRTTAPKTRPARKSDPVVPLSHDESTAENHSFNGTISPDCHSSIALSENGDFAPGSTKSPDRDSLTTRDSQLDLLHGSSRYDAFILKEEDSKNMNWLHSVEDKSDQSPVFDHRFEPLPEPFGLL